MPVSEKNRKTAARRPPPAAGGQADLFAPSAPRAFAVEPGSEAVSLVGPSGQVTVCLGRDGRWAITITGAPGQSDAPAPVEAAPAAPAAAAAAPAPVSAGNARGGEAAAAKPPASFWTPARLDRLASAVAVAGATWNDVARQVGDGCPADRARKQARERGLSRIPAPAKAAAAAPAAAAPAVPQPPAAPAAEKPAAEKPVAQGAPASFWTPARLDRLASAVAVAGATWNDVARRVGDGCPADRARKQARKSGFRRAPDPPAAARPAPAAVPRKSPSNVQAGSAGGFWTRARDRRLAAALARTSPAPTWASVARHVGGGCTADKARRRGRHLGLRRPDPAHAPAGPAPDAPAEATEEPAALEGEAPRRTAVVIQTPALLDPAAVRAFGEVLTYAGIVDIVARLSVDPADVGAFVEAHAGALTAEADIYFLWTDSIEADAAIARALRRAGNRRVIYALSDCQSHQEASAIDSGIDDIWPFPRDGVELVGRIRKSFDMTSRGLRPRTKRLGNVVVDYDDRCAYVDAPGLPRVPVGLTRTEFELLRLLIDQTAGGVSVKDFRKIRAEQAELRGAQGAAARRSSRDVHIVRLRTKIRDAGGNLEIYSDDGRSYARVGVPATGRAA